LTRAAAARVPSVLFVRAEVDEDLAALAAPRAVPVVFGAALDAVALEAAVFGAALDAAALPVAALADVVFAAFVVLDFGEDLLLAVVVAARLAGGISNS
jgi:hypothetical protein